MATPNITSGSGTPEQNPFLKLDDTSDRQVLGLNAAYVTTVGNAIESQLKSYDEIQKQRPLTTQEESDLEKVLLQKQQLLEAVSKDASFKTCFARETNGKSWTFKEGARCASIAGSPLYLWSEQLLNQERSLPDPCGETTMAKINVELTRFFKTLKAIKKYGQLYVYGTVNKLAKITDLISSTSQIIAAVLKVLVQRIRSWLMEKIRKAIEVVMDTIFNSIAAQIKDAVVDEVVKAIMCKFDDIIKGLSKLVTEFLFALVQNVINPAFCAVEQFTNALINNLTAQIDRAIQPLLSAINDVLGGAIQVAGSVFQAIDFVLGFEQFLCTAPDCPNIKSYTGNDGPSKTETDDFYKFLDVPDSGQAIETASGWINNFSVFPGDKLGDAPTIGLDCNTDAFVCGPPQIEIFGGGGAGATARAVVNRLGQIIGADMTAFGSGYTNPPFVTFYDSCGSGNNASAYSVINENGQVIQIVIVNSGYNYPNTVTGVDEFGNPIVTGANTGTSGGGNLTVQNPDGTIGIVTTYGGNPIPTTQEVVVLEYVACLEEIQVISTGIGYQQTDSISISPNIPNLQAAVQLTEEGQIIAIKILNRPCGLNEIPEITINSQTGVGAVFRPILSVQKVEQFDPIVDFDPQKLVRVVDCVGK